MAGPRRLEVALKVLTLTRDAFVGINEHSDTHYRAMLNLRQDSQGRIFGTGRPSPFRLGLIELHAVTCELVDESAKQKVEASRTVHAALKRHRTLACGQSSGERP